MKRCIIMSIRALAAVMILACSHQAATAFDNIDGYRFVIVGNLDSDAERARLLSMARGNRVSAIQRELSSDPAFIRQLRSEGLALHNVIGRARAGNRRMIVYVR